MNNLRTWEAIVLASQMGFVFAASVVIGLLVGHFLDGVTGLSPVFTILGALAGTAGGIFSVIQIVAFMQNRNGKSD